MADRVDTRGGASRWEAERPAKLSGGSWWRVLKCTVLEFREDNLTDWAAALTYYGVLSIFPALVAVVSIVGLVGESATNTLLENLSGFAPGPANEILTNALNELSEAKGAAGILFIAGLAGALWSASGYVGAFIRAANVVWDVEEGRPIWRTLPLRLVITLVMVVLLAVISFAVVVTGPLAETVGELLGLGDAAVTAWDIAKWPVLVAVVSLMLAILYYAAPNIRQPGFRWVSPGSIVAVVLWIVASAAFALYAANFGSYNKTYGSLGAVIIFLVWLWISNVAVLLGAEFNAELARGRRLEAGHPEEEEPFLPPRSEP
jgi:membrane protein